MLKKLLLGLGLGLVFGALLLAGVILVWNIWVAPQPVAQQPLAGSPMTPSTPDAGSGTPDMSITIVPAPLTKEGIPAKLGSLTLTKTAQGTDALTELTQMHGSGLDLTGGYRADYAGEGSQATLWVGLAKDAAAAQAMVDSMAQKIDAGNPTFSDLQTLNIGGRKLYTAQGQDQQHFFYAVNDKIVWLAADPDQAADALHSLWGAVK
jgi:hypothetical protein